MNPLLALASTTLVAATALGQSASVADQVRALDKQQREAALRGDTAFMEHYAAPEYVSINPAGVLSTKEQSLARMKSGDVKLDAIDIEQEQVHVYGETVVITALEHVRGSFKGNKFDSTAQYSRVWILQDGSWKLTLFQETPVAHPGK